jgi:hypothetical protein
MPRDDFDRRPRKKGPPRHDPAAFGRFVDEAPARKRQPITIWRVLGVLAAIIFAGFILDFFLGFSLVTCLLAPVLGLVLYEVWYLTVESTI